ncbi:hypothetical protein MA16_Dca016943 [Dendrobium catenatum]|uniref:Uncharacterized protein n=1 Tax=Dendrobium catenatum TaxID=906689 RepID=A0A2I0VWI6_9ASPA|nr:hypothetical protein MA16_Dca016943 [Dendrobium catenatum]
MADPEIDHDFDYNSQGEIDILRSHFYETEWGYDDSIEDYVNRILFCLAETIELQQPRVTWHLIRRSTPPPPTTFSWIKAFGVATILASSFSVLKASLR